MIIIDKNTINEILQRKIERKRNIKKIIKSLTSWFGLCFLVSIGVDFTLWVNEFSIDKSNMILKMIISIALWFYIDKEE